MARNMGREKAVRTFSMFVAVSGIVACSVSAEVGADGEGAESGPGSAAAAKAATDGVKSGDETDVDCGGSAPKKCAVGQMCNVGADCETSSCKAGRCAAPAPDDGAKNGDETDVDCGGTKAPKCAVGKSCKANGDCVSDACSYANKCVASPSCTGHHGGDTCGAGETGTAGAKHESCCTTISMPDGPNGAFSIDKYQVTAGRMRAFIERTNGNVRGWIEKAAPKDWNDAWTDELPTNMTEALYMLGPGQKQGCNVVNQGGRTYWQPAIDGDPDEKSDFTKEVLDEKALNCVPWHLSAALCAFDGKRLVRAAEMRYVFRNGNTTTYPWQFQDNSGFNPGTGDDRLSHQYNYQTPSPPASMRLVGSGDNAYPLDHAFYVSPPGRFPKGANKDGVQDAAGNVLPWTLDATRQILWTFSWEKHKGDLSTSTWNMSGATNGYYAIGIRCASD